MVFFHMVLFFHTYYSSACLASCLLKIFFTVTVTVSWKPDSEDFHANWGNCYHILLLLR